MDLIKLMTDHQVMQVGDFTLKSGIQSPIFFNFGRINSGSGLAQLGALFRDKILAQDWRLDCLVGPAYKGIPLATATAISLSQVIEWGGKIRVIYNRKEAKSHGEGGHWVGDLAGQSVVLIDDVLTAGTAIQQAVSAVEASAAKLIGIVIALDRQQKGSEGITVRQQLATRWGVPILSLLNLTEMIAYYNSIGHDRILTALNQIAQ